jgi:multidrug efflux system membrane fusion protein
MHAMTEPVVETKNVAADRQVAPAKSHPLAAEPVRSRVPALLGWLILGAALGAAWWYSPLWYPHVEPYLRPPAASGGKKGPRAIPVSTALVQQRDLELYLNGLGTVTAFNTVTIRSRVGGEVTNVAFTEGQFVKQEDLLAEIDPRPYQMLRDQAQAQVARDAATLKLAETTLTRQLDLMKSQATTPQLVDQQVALVDQARAALQMDQANLENANLQLSYCRITAPISGRIGLRLVDQGNILEANSLQGIAVITQLEPISLTFTIPQNDIPRVLKRMQDEELPLAVEAFDRDFSNRLAVGQLTATDNQVDAATGTLRLKATFENKDHVLFPNQFVNARLGVELIRDAVLIPNAAIQRGPDEDYVYVVRPDETVELRPVVIGPGEGAESSVKSGLRPGETIVITGLDKLQPDARITLPKAGQGKGGQGKAGQKQNQTDGAPQSKPDHEKGSQATPPASRNETA